MNNVDNLITFLDAWKLSEKGGDVSQAIERQERRGQAEVVRTKRLPKKVNSNTIPNEIYFKGVDNSMDYDTRSAITQQNVLDYTKEQYLLMGIEILSKHDDLFYNVKLPEGWEIKATSHSMWNEVRDSKGRKRMTFFYKAAFYDRDAFTNFSTRFNLSVDHIADPNTAFEIWEASDFQGTIKDGDVIICQTATVAPGESYPDNQEIKEKLWEELEAFMAQHYPDYKNIHAYWD